ncbi:MAG: acyl-CoA dehydrogenase, partial [Hyphomicrobiales bacterium]|nr:acyl-CoA dehydrogenase [Hyphomicrobiales bacterium]
MDDAGLAGGDLTNVPLGNDYPEIREAVRAICKRFPSEYWRKLEDEEAYASEFVAALTEAGFMAAL